MDLPFRGSLDVNLQASGSGKRYIGANKIIAGLGSLAASSVSCYIYGVKKPIIPTFFKKERNQTDDSLTTERVKTDESLFAGRKLAENRTDEKVKGDRFEADQSIADSRIAVDDDITRSTADQGNPTDEEEAIDVRLQEQRKLVDGAVEKERASMDAAIQRERDSKEAVLVQFLDREREETDVNLLNERKKSDAALTTRDEFLAIVSHDLRNPIGAILSCAELVTEDPSYVGLSAEAKTSLDLIRRSAESSLRLIGDILDMERVVEGKLELRVARHDVGELIREIVAVSSPLAHAKNISLREITSDASLFAFCDRDRIAQVLSNLVSNAIKFTPGGGTILLKARQLEGDLHVSVSDTGPGISPDQAKRIFDRYTQLGNKDRGGLGLGLYISKMLVEAHQGRLWVVSSLGAGSSFCFSLKSAS